VGESEKALEIIGKTSCKISSVIAVETEVEI
jgi:hypothetical protein